MKETELVHYNFNDLRTRIVNFHFLALGALLFVIFKNFWVELLNKSKITFLVPTFLVPLCVCVCVCGGGGGFTSIYREGFISLEQVGYEGTDQRCYVEDVEFLYRFSSSLLWNAEPNLSTSRFILFAHQKRAEPRLN